ncbi:hypothetical protein [Erythrobacter sp. NAP1]|uniref:hypothetical protein n=1 Tax=Erythrobacter sp. NAP1 TaxID=237727 RepID=UPI0002DAED39|nr:hypothetical protein [Erythrobacter sp. NAP1]
MFTSLGEEPLYRLAYALWLAMVAGAAIGGGVLTLTLLSQGNMPGLLENWWMVPLAPVMFGWISLIYVIPCAVAFGIPSALLIMRLKPGSLLSLAVSLGFATAVQIACIALFMWDEYSQASDYAFTTPFAWGAALGLWWALRPRRADRSQSR